MIFGYIRQCLQPDDSLPSPLTVWILYGAFSHFTISLSLTHRTSPPLRSHFERKLYFHFIGSWFLVNLIGPFHFVHSVLSCHPLLRPFSFPNFLHCPCYSTPSSAHIKRTFQTKSLQHRINFFLFLFYINFFNGKMIECCFHI